MNKDATRGSKFKSSKSSKVQKFSHTLPKSRGIEKFYFDDARKLDGRSGLWNDCCLPFFPQYASRVVEISIASPSGHEDGDEGRGGGGGGGLTPEKNHLALEVSESKAKIRKLNQQL
jgi:hypothetical protein